MSTLVDYSTTLHLPKASNYAWISSIGMVAGYICGIAFIPKYMSQAMALRVCASIAIVGTIGVVLTPGIFSIWFISLIAIGCSLIWPALWPLAIADLGRFTKAGASLLVMAIAGGAIIPTIFGFVKDAFGTQNAYWVCLPCFLFILYYGVEGHKKRV